MSKPNRLINETSPYLLQHSNNPVDWYPWCDEAFQKAADEDKPIFLSIGYSTCHWCHVMEKESFEDEEVAALMNNVFVSIKVDREERPDIDHIYMMVCQMMTGSGGWPLSIIMTPDRKPFFAGTYFPKENRYGRIGFKELIRSIDNAWKTKRNDIIESADDITNYLKQIYKKDSDANITEEIVDKAFYHFAKRFDDKFGGFGSSPKFPSPHNLMFLLRHWKKTGNPLALEMVTKTLTNMRMGGIYDHVGFGFHRYSTDKEWLVPHFEKMLYDQAMLIIIYSEAYTATGNSEFKKTAEEIIEYLLRDMHADNGGFYSAEDADSEGEEGKFYVWTNSELIDILGTEDADFASRLFNATETGNFLEESTRKNNGTNILHLKKSRNDLSEETGLSAEELDKKIELIRIKLYDYRKKRIPPFKDDKILLDWNALMIAALSIAGRSFNNKKYLSIAAGCYAFINKFLTASNGALLHMYRDNRASVSAKLDDYAFFIWGLIELYQSNFDTKYILHAVELCNSAIDKFWDNESGGFYFSTDDDLSLLVRTKEIYDGAIPSGNSVMFSNLLRLSRITADNIFEEYSGKLLNTFSESISGAPSGSTFLISYLDFYWGNSYEIIISSDQLNKAVDDILSKLNKNFIPNKIIVAKYDPLSPPFNYLKNYSSKSGTPLIYVCKNFTCELPIKNLEGHESLFSSL
ncbi:MAG: thioredoxin domain-containing protein [Melioribacter sp.]|nr:thioredoxin domain-containing protein [Melioribacter sp.]